MQRRRRATRWRWSARAATGILLASGLASRADPAPPAAARAADRSLQASRTPVPPKIDGHLDDAAWTLSSVDDRFTQNFPDADKPPTERTEVRVLYDDKALYVGVRCHDREPGRIVEWLTRRDRETTSDRVGIDVDSRGDGVTAYHFDVNVSGVLFDGLRFNDTEFNADWDGLWSAATSRDDGGWTVEVAIPWRTLRFDGRAPAMRFQVRRLLARRQEIDEWVSVPRSAHAEVSRYGSLVGVSGLGARRLVQIQPYVATGLQLRSNQDPSTLNGSSGLANAGLDARIGLSSGLTLDATLNPDFGQVEADQVVLNLTTFEVFYPEKRPFFLEGADLFGMPITQFYTRRVGRPPSTWNGAPDETLAAQPLTGRIYGAAKLAGRIAPHLSIAALDAVTAEQDALVWRNQTLSPRLLDPTTNFGVVRLRSDWGASYVGAMATTVNRFERAGAASPAPGGLCPGDFDETYLPDGGGRCSHNAYTAGIDGRYQTADGAWGLGGQAVGSLVDGGPRRIRYDGTVLAPGTSGYGLFLRGGKLGGEPLLFALRYEGYSPTLDLDDAGYLRQANLHSAAAALTLRTTRPLGRTLESSWDTFAWAKTAWDGTLLDPGFGTNLYARFDNLWQSSLSFGYQFDRWDNRETRDGAYSEKSGGVWADFWLQSDLARAVGGTLNLHAWSVRHGGATSGDLTLVARPAPWIELSLTPRYSWTVGDLRWAETSPDGRTRWFGDQESRSFDVTLRGTYTFTPRVSFQLYAQVFVAGYHYSNWLFADGDPAGSCPAGENPCAPARLSWAQMRPAAGFGNLDDSSFGAVNLNALVRWEYQPGSTLLAVYTRSQGQPTFDPATGAWGGPDAARFARGPAVDNILVKMSYVWR